MRRTFQVIIFIIMLLTLGYYVNDTFGKTIAWALSLLTTLAVITLVITIFMENRHPSSTVAWILMLALVPVVGFFFYLLFGQNYRKRRKYSQKAKRDKHSYGFLDKEQMARHPRYAEFTPDQRLMLQLTNRMSKSPVTFSSHTEVLTNGEETFASLITELKKARHHIHMEYYIYRDDEIGREIKQILMEKARQGVEVRFMYDAVGSLYLKKPFVEEMRRAGVEVAAFGPVKLRVFSSKVNYRNHRKIVIVDGNVGFIGGLNVGDEYLSRNKTYGFWRDTHMIVRGEAVQTLQVIFLQDWRHMTEQHITGAQYFVACSSGVEEQGAVQIIASGPDQEFQTMKNVFFSMLTSAKRSIWIATPYFIPDEDIFTALKVAALSGIEVKLLFPSKPDKWLPFLASHSYFTGLIEAGARIYEYEKGFLHSKLIIVDGELATIGTTNMDMRSFYLNFEVNALLLRTESVQRLVSDFERDLQSATRIREEQFLRRRMATRFLESVARLFSPLL
ncbi:cardiolipin synthase [Paenibacillus sp. ACRRX]|uniref:cardiolipin synthase n=1 Tax=Paenibacillus sp. ACRRX TaxID=2918206 RepID=UPI001EF47085|nr:cardiolipin synthase [Paenibacillus sp. ACRRX]MCG7408072.1 cardiolipin synthase [Paenibacillus sp. ACRRX]